MSALVARRSPSGYRNIAKRKLKYILRCKTDPERVLQSMTKASEEWELVMIEPRNRAKDGGVFRSREPSAKERAGSKCSKKDEDRSEIPITCLGCREQGQTLRQCKRGEPGWGKNRGKRKGAPGARSRVKAQETAKRGLQQTINNPKQLQCWVREEVKEEPYSLVVDLSAEPRSEQPTHLLRESVRFRWHLPPSSSNWVPCTHYKILKLLASSDRHPPLGG